MKKLVSSAGIVALGMVAAQVTNAAELTSSEGKALPWLKASVTLRGFYDDNFATQPKGPLKKDSFGFDLSPRVGGEFNYENRTSGSLSYQYGMRYFANRTPDADHSHQINGAINHKFSEDYSLDASDSFVIAQEPQMLDPDNLSTKLRVNGDNKRNFAKITFDGKLGRQLGVQLGYQNNIFDYQQETYQFFMNRMEHKANVDVYYDLKPNTRLFVGYAYGYMDYNGKGDPNPLDNWKNANAFDNSSHFFYVGVRETLARGLDIAVKGGVQYTEWANTGPEYMVMPTSDSSVIPYVDASVTYVFLATSTATVGVRHQRGAVEIGALDTETTTVYGMVNHQFTSKFNGRLMGVYQNSAFYQGQNGFQDLKENYYSAGVELGYLIYKGPVSVTAEAGYNFDYLQSREINNIPGSDRGFSRNRVWMGLRASY